MQVARIRHREGLILLERWRSPSQCLCRSHPRLKKIMPPRVACARGRLSSSSTALRAAVSSACRRRLTGIEIHPNCPLRVIVGETRPTEGIIGLKIDGLPVIPAGIFISTDDPIVVATQIGILASFRIDVASAGMRRRRTRFNRAAMALAATSGNVRQHCSLSRS